MVDLSATVNRSWLGVRFDPSTSGNRTIAATHNRVFKIIFFSRNFKLHCLLIGSVSFCGPTGIDSVGASQYPKVSAA